MATDGGGDTYLEEDLSCPSPQSSRKNEDDPNLTSRPFEWLTSPASLEPFIHQALYPNDNNDADPSFPTKYVLHVGSGSSVLGEHILQNHTLGVRLVVNIDCDEPTLIHRQDEWYQYCRQQQQEQSSSAELLDPNRLRFLKVDLATETIPIIYDDDKNDDVPVRFDLAIDKSTLDCALCSDHTTAGLLTQVYTHLKPGVIYLVISFQDINLLRPLLTTCPGMTWESIQHFVMERQVEDLITKQQNHAFPKDGLVVQDKFQSSTEKESFTTQNNRNVWCQDGTFSPNDLYRKTVNVLLLQKSLNDKTAAIIDRDTVNRHVHVVNDEWFQSQHPLLTHKRQETLRHEFGTHTSIGLEQAYQMLFTDAEREHLSYDLFLEDWQAFLETRPELPNNELTFDTAVQFLQEMQ